MIDEQRNAVVADLSGGLVSVDTFCAAQDGRFHLNETILCARGSGQDRGEEMRRDVLFRLFFWITGRHTAVPGGMHFPLAKSPILFYSIRSDAVFSVRCEDGIDGCLPGNIHMSDRKDE
jgi:hypothetical protein